MPVRMPIIKQTRDNKCWYRSGEKGTFVQLLVGFQIGNWYSHYENQ